MKWLKKKKKINKQELIDKLWELEEQFEIYWKIEDVLRVIREHQHRIFWRCQGHALVAVQSY